MRLLRNGGHPALRADFCSQKGFTLIELIAVIVISSVLFIALGNRFTGFTFTVQAGRDDVVAALFYAQQIAMARDSIDNPVQFIAAVDSIDIRENGVSLSNYPLKLPNGVAITSGDATLNYDKLGRVNTATDILIVLGAADASATITVDPSGYAY